MGWLPRPVFGSLLLMRAHLDKCNLWLRGYESPLPSPSRECKEPCKTLSRARTFQQLCLTKYSWRLSHLLNAPEPERIKMPGSHPQVAQTPGESGLFVSFQIGGDAGLSIPPLPHTLHILSMSFIYLPGFQHERFLKSLWRRSEMGPQQ